MSEIVFDRRSTCVSTRFAKSGWERCWTSVGIGSKPTTVVRLSASKGAYAICTSGAKSAPMSKIRKVGARSPSMLSRSLFFS
jgi:hypothetical protein